MVIHTIYRKVHSLVLVEFVIHFKKSRIKDRCFCPRTLVSNYLHQRTSAKAHNTSSLPAHEAVSW